MEIKNVRIRLNRDESDDKLLGWGECLLGESANNSWLWLNNVKIRKKDEQGNIKLLFDYPHKLVEKGGKLEKKHYFKPITREMYKLIEQAFISEIRRELANERSKPVVVPVDFAYVSYTRTISYGGGDSGTVPTGGVGKVDKVP